MSALLTEPARPQTKPSRVFGRGTLSAFNLYLRRWATTQLCCHEWRTLIIGCIGMTGFIAAGFAVGARVIDTNIYLAAAVSSLALLGGALVVGELADPEGLQRALAAKRANDSKRARRI